MSLLWKEEHAQPVSSTSTVPLSFSLESICRRDPPPSAAEHEGQCLLSCGVLHLVPQIRKWRRGACKTFSYRTSTHKALNQAVMLMELLCSTWSCSTWVCSSCSRSKIHCTRQTSGNVAMLKFFHILWLIWTIRAVFVSALISSTVIVHLYESTALPLWTKSIASATRESVSSTWLTLTCCRSHNRNIQITKKRSS